MNRKILTFTLVTGLFLTSMLAISTPAEASYRSFLRDYINNQNQLEPRQPSQPTQTTQPNTSQNNQIGVFQPTSTVSHTITQREMDMLRWINQERAKVGARPLQIDLELSKWAKIKSQDMKNNNYFAHTSPTYGSPFEMMRSAGIQYVRAAENLSASQSPYMSHLRLMASEGHRRNILNPNFTHIGIGIIDQNPSGVLVTQLFNQK